MSVIRHLAGHARPLLLALISGICVVACGDRQEEAVTELYENEYAFSVEEFFRAAAAGDLRAVRWFLDAGMDPEVSDVSQSQALHMAAEVGRSKIIEELLARGVDPEIERLDGRTPLMLAAGSGDGRSVELLLDAGVSTLEKDSKGWSALALAAYGGFARAVEALVPFSRAHLNDALLLAAIGGHVGAIDPLVSGAAVVDARSPDQRTPLMLAAARGNEDAVRILLHHGANWYATDEGQSTASQLAAEEGHGDIVHLLDSAHLNDAESVAGDESFVPDEGGGAVIYSSRTRRLDGEALLGSGSTEIDLREELHMLAYRERQLPIYFGGDADALGEEAEVRLLFGEHETYRLRVGDRVPKTELGVLAIEVRWSKGKEGQGRPVRSVRLVVKDLVSGEVIGVTPDDPGRSAKSFALMEHGSTGQVYQVRRGDRFRLMGADFRVLEIRASEVLIEDAVSAEVTSIER